MFVHVVWSKFVSNTFLFFRFAYSKTCNQLKSRKFLWAIRSVAVTAAATIFFSLSFGCRCSPFGLCVCVCVLFYLFVSFTNRKLHVHKIRTWIYNGWLNLNIENPINFKSICKLYCVYGMCFSIGVCFLLPFHRFGRSILLVHFFFLFDSISLSLSLSFPVLNFCFFFSAARSSILLFSILWKFFVLMCTVYYICVVIF